MTHDGKQQPGAQRVRGGETRRGDRLLYEERAEGCVRYRALHRGTKAKRRVWLEGTNQPGDDHWWFLETIYQVRRVSGRYVSVWVTDRTAYMKPSTVRLFATDLREVAP